jgi:hypothetical protein
MADPARVKVCQGLLGAATSRRGYDPRASFVGPRLLEPPIHAPRSFPASFLPNPTRGTPMSSFNPRPDTLSRVAPGNLLQLLTSTASAYLATPLTPGGIGEVGVVDSAFVRGHHPADSFHCFRLGGRAYQVQALRALGGPLLRRACPPGKAPA